MFPKARRFLLYATLFVASTLYANAEAAGVKLSAIASGGSLASSTDQLVAVRSGTTDVLLTVGSSCVENLTSIVIDNGAGGLTLGAGQVTNAMLANSSITIAGHSTALGGTATIACGDLSNSGTACTAVAPANTTATASNFFTAYTAATGAFTKAQPAFSDISGQATNAQLATQTANTVLGALTATTPSGLALPSCTDTSGNHLNYTSGTGFSCGTSDLHVGTLTSVATTSPITGGTITGVGTIACATCATTTNGGAISGTSPVAVSAAGAISITGSSGGVLASGGPAFTATPVLGVQGTSAGTLGLASSGAASAVVTINNYAATSAYNFNLAATAGSAGNVAISGGGGTAPWTWDTTSGTGTVIPLQSGATMTALTVQSNSTGAAALYLTSGAGEVALYSAGLSSVAANLQPDNGNMQVIAITSNATLTLVAPAHPSKTNFIIKQDSTGHTYTIATCKWAGGSTITYSSTANAIDEISTMYDGSTFYCMGGAAFQ